MLRKACQVAKRMLHLEPLLLRALPVPVGAHVMPCTDRGLAPSVGLNSKVRARGKKKKKLQPGIVKVSLKYPTNHLESVASMVLQ